MPPSWAPVLTLPRFLSDFGAGAAVLAGVAAGLAGSRSAALGLRRGSCDLGGNGAAAGPAHSVGAGFAGDQFRMPGNTIVSPLSKIWNPCALTSPAAHAPRPGRCPRRCCWRLDPRALGDKGLPFWCTRVTLPNRSSSWLCALIDTWAAVTTTPAPPCVLMSARGSRSDINSCRSGTWRPDAAVTTNGRLARSAPA